MIIFQNSKGNLPYIKKFSNRQNCNATQANLHSTEKYQQIVVVAPQNLYAIMTFKHLDTSREYKILQENTREYKKQQESTRYFKRAQDTTSREHTILKKTLSCTFSNMPNTKI